VKPPQRLVEPLPTPSFPAKALSFSCPHHMSPDFLFHPVLHKRKARTGVPYCKVAPPPRRMGLTCSISLAFPGHTCGRRVFPSTAGRLACQTGSSQWIDRLSLRPGIRPSIHGLALSLAHHRVANPARGQANDSWVRRLGVGLDSAPGTLAPGYSVPLHLRFSVLGPIPPTRRHIATSPTSDLYAMPSLCGSAFGDPRVVRFHCPFLPDMPPPMSPGRSESCLSSWSILTLAFAEI